MGKRSCGEGSLWQNQNGTWTAQYYAPTGSSRARPSKTFPSQRKARTWLTEQLRDIDTGSHVDPSTMLFSIWWDKWLDVYKKRSVTEATYQTYVYSRARLPKTLFQMRLSQITKTDIQKALNGLIDAKLSRRTVEITRTSLRMCLGQAVDDGLLRKNPAIGTTLPVEDANEAIPLTPEEEANLITELIKPVRLTAKGIIDKKHQATKTMHDAILLTLKSGIRREEVCQLEWSDWNNPWLHVRGTKTDDANRMVPITDSLVLQMLERRQLSGGKYIFETRNGTPIEGANLYDAVKELCGHTCHELRHTFCTNGARAKINPKVLQTITGHKDVNTLLKVYTHVSEQDKLDAVMDLSKQRRTP